MSKEVLVFSIYAIVVAYILITKRTKLYLPAAVALGVSFIWNYLARGMYDYNTVTATLLGINLYALTAWAAGLLFGYIFFQAVLSKVKATGLWQEVMLFNVFYLPILITLETVAYHTFGVVNQATAAYPGLPVCDCIHAPGWMQAIYLLMGTIFIVSLWLCRKALDWHSASLDSRVKLP